MKTRVSLRFKYGLFVFLAVGLLVAASVNSQVGREQSPIDIDSEAVVPAVLPELNFMYSTRVSLTVENEGPGEEFGTVKAFVPDGAATLKVGAEAFELDQFHWHIPSEHHLDGKELPMEMHLVHERFDATGDKKLLVVGVWIVAGKKPHRELDKIFSALPALKGEEKEVERFNLTKLLPDELESFRYDGSLTTPEFGEGVQWIVLKEPIKMSVKQIKAFKALFPLSNDRDVQDINGRIVKTEMEDQDMDDEEEPDDEDDIEDDEDDD